MEHRPDEAPTSPASTRGRIRELLTAPYAPAALAAVAFLIALATQLGYKAGIDVPSLWIGFVVAGIAFAGAAYGATRVPAVGSDGGTPWVRDGVIALTRRQELMILAAILLLAIFFRWFRFLEFPPGLWYDEAINGTDAISIIERDHLTVWRESNFGHSTIFFYLLIASFWVFDFTVLAMRVVPAVAGLAAVFAFYWLARWLTGPVPALVATALLACGRWAVTFSRISWEASLMPLLEIMSVFFLVRALETKNKFYFFLAGGSLAAGIYTYLAFRFIPIVMAFILVYIAMTEWKLIRSNIAGLLLYAASFVVVLFPLAQFALQNQDQFLERTREINVFREIENEGSWEPLRHNIRSSLGMMNVAGDKNGRHNLPGEPMLDVITGVLFVLGIAASIWGLRSWRKGHIAGWYLLVLIPGALTISVENPSAIRVIGAIPPIYLAVALTIAVMQRAFATVRYGAQAFAIAALALVGIAAGANYYTFFEVQARDQKVYEEFTPENTQVGEIVAARGDDERVFVSRDFEGHPAVRVLGHETTYVPYTVGRNLIFPPGDKDVLLIADALQFAAIPTLQRLYPNLTIEDYVDPFDRVFFTRVTIPANDTVALHELPLAVTREGVAVADVPAQASPDYEWTAAALAGGPVTATWRGHLWSARFPGTTEFRVEGSANAVVEINGTEYRLAGPSDPAVRVDLPTGEHDVRLTADVTQPGAVKWFIRQAGENERPAAELLYATTVGGDGFRVVYREGTDFSAAPAPAAGQVPFAVPVDISTDYRAIEYQAIYDARAEGTYGFALEGANSVQLFVDDQLVVDNGGSHAVKRVEAEIGLAPGPHLIAIQYTVFDRPNWNIDVRVPGGDWKTLTGSEVSPPEGAYVPPALVRLTEDASWPGASGFEGIGKIVAVAALEDGRIAVAARDRVAIVSADGVVESTFDPGLTDIIDIAVAESGDLLIADRATRTLVVADTAGGERRRVSDGFDSVWGVGSAGGGALVASPSASNVYRLPLEGGEVAELEMSNSFERAKQPSDADSDEDGNIYVADFESRRILVSTDGGASVARSWAGVGGTGDQVPHIAPEGRLVFATDPTNQRVVVYDRAGKQRGAYVFRATTRGLRPVGIAAYEQYVYVADIENGNVHRLIVEIPPETASQLP